MYFGICCFIVFISCQKKKKNLWSNRRYDQKKFCFKQDIFSDFNLPFFISSCDDFCNCLAKHDIFWNADMAIYRYAGEWNIFVITAYLLLGGYLINWLPYFPEERILFLHHYLPCLLYKIIVISTLLNHLCNVLLRSVKLFHCFECFRGFGRSFVYFNHISDTYYKTIATWFWKGLLNSMCVYQASLTF